MEELGKDAAGLRALEVEAHEAGPGEGLGLVGMAEEDLRVLRGHREDEGVGVGDPSGAGDEAHGGDVGAGVAAAHEVVAGAGLQGEGEGENDERGHEARGDAAAERLAHGKAQPTSPGEGRDQRARRHHRRRPRQGEETELTEEKRHPGGHGDAHGDRQEEGLVEGCRLLLVARQEGQEEKAGDEEEDEAGEDRRERADQAHGRRSASAMALTRPAALTRSPPAASRTASHTRRTCSSRSSG